MQLIIILNIFVQILVILIVLYFFGIYASFFLIQNVFNILLLLPFLITLLIFFAFNSKNPVFSLLYILLSFIFISILVFSLGIEFLTFTFLIVYIGAVMMLFLFVIMLFNLQEKYLVIKQTYFKLFIKFFIFICLYTFVEKIIKLNILNKISPISDSNSLDFYTIFFLSNHTLNGNTIFTQLYTIENSFIFLLITLLLLYSLISAITIAMFTTKNT